MNMSKLSGLYVVTDQDLSPGRTHTGIAEAAIAGGAGVIQLRDKSASDREFFESAVAIRELTRQAGALFIVNDRIAVAAACEADGVNIGQTDMPAWAARKVLGPDVIIGVSCENLEQARQAVLDGADYIGFGPVFSTNTKLDCGPETGLGVLAEVCREISLPVAAIGGISLDNIAEIAKAGADCAAVVSAVVCAEDMVKATEELAREFSGARR